MRLTDGQTDGQTDVDSKSMVYRLALKNSLTLILILARGVSVRNRHREIRRFRVQYMYCSYCVPREPSLSVSLHLTQAHKI